MSREDQDPTIEAGKTSRIRTTIGAYHLREKIGEGGMGEVYLADQVQPVKRQVALKLIKQGMDTREVVARFETERQALALMDHPCIARVYDAGSAPDGRPYFVMEYVPGIPITEYCDRYRLSVEERLQLFIQVCEAVQHAHHKAIIHRDVKPSNVLVMLQDNRPVPKVIDFGVAKATAQHLSERTLFTEQGQLIGTPEYMSPEQAELTGLNVDTRTDVYSLGVLLYELVSGLLPFDPRELRAAGFSDILKKIREEEPVRPSSRLETTADGAKQMAEKRRTQPDTLVRRIRGDLDWIVMKALEKDRNRRYNSPSELASDIQRHLKDEPVLASPPSFSYRSWKFIRRHRSGVALAATVVIMLIVLAGTMTVQTARIARERDRANQEARTSREIANFLVDLFKVADPMESTGQNVSARDLLTRGAERISTSLSEEPLIRAELQKTMGRAFENLGIYDRAESLYRSALESEIQLLGANDLRTIRTHGELGSAIWRQGRFDEAEQILQQVHDLKVKLLGPEDPSTLNSANNLANLHFTLGRLDQAEALYEESYEKRMRIQGRDHPDVLGAANNLSNVYVRQKRYDEAAELIERTFEARVRTQGEDHPDTMGIASNLADLYVYQRRFAEAEELYKDNLERRRRVLGDSHPDTLMSLNNLGWLYSQQDRHDLAEKYFMESYKKRLESLGKDHPDTLTSAFNLGDTYLELGRYAEAKDYLSRSVKGWEAVVPDNHPRLGRARNSLATLLYMEKDYAGSEAIFRRVLEAWKASPVNDDQIQTVLYNLACVTSLQGNQAEALAFLEEAVELGLAGEEVLTDPDLSGIRETNRFQQIAEVVRGRLSDSKASAGQATD